MRSDLIGVVARFGTAKRLVLEEVCLKHLVPSQAKLSTTYYDYLQSPPFSFLHISAMFLSLFISMFLAYWMNCMKIILNFSEFSSLRGELNMLSIHLRPGVEIKLQEKRFLPQREISPPCPGAKFWL